MIEGYVTAGFTAVIVTVPFTFRAPTLMPTRLPVKEIVGLFTMLKVPFALM